MMRIFPSRTPTCHWSLFASNIVWPSTSHQSTAIYLVRSNSYTVIRLRLVFIVPQTTQSLAVTCPVPTARGSGGIPTSRSFSGLPFRRIDAHFLARDEGQRPSTSTEAIALNVLLHPNESAIGSLDLVYGRLDAEQVILRYRTSRTSSKVCPFILAHSSRVLS
jgi:hypothetical protein